MRGMSQCHARVADGKGTEKDREAGSKGAEGQKEKVQLVIFLVGTNTKLSNKSFHAVPLLGSDAREDDGSPQQTAIYRLRCCQRSGEKSP